MAWLDQVLFWHWMIVGLLFIILEMLSPGAVFLWMGFSAFVISVFLFFVPTIHPFLQIFVFFLLSVSSLLLFKRYQDKHPVSSDQPFLNRRAEQYIGRAFILDAPIQNGMGKIRVDDVTWKVSGEDMPASQWVKVIAVEDSVLKVQAQQ